MYKRSMHQRQVQILILAVLFLIQSGCLFGPATFKDRGNFLSSDAMQIINSNRREKIVSVRVYTSATSSGENKKVLDTVFAQPADRFTLPLSKENLNKLYVDIYIKLTRNPGLFMNLKPGDLIKKKRIFFEGDKY